MPLFEYRARTPAGKVLKSQMEAPSVGDVRDALRAKNLVVLEIKPPKAGLQGDIPLPAFMRKPPGIKQVAVFAKQLSTLINAGVPLVQSMAILQKQTESAPMAEVIRKVRLEVEAGQPFSSAISQHPKVFDRLFVNLIRAGEVSGTLDLVLERVAAFQEKEMETRGRIKSAMTYPTTVLGIALLITYFLLTTVVPQFAGILIELGAPLPPITRMLIAISGFLQSKVIFILIAVGLLVFAYNKIYSTPKGRYAIDGIKLKLPIVGNLQKKSAISSFSRTFGLLMQSGVNIIEALDITRSTAGNVVIEEAIEGARDVVMVGEPMSASLATSPFFPGMVVSMISIGEETGGIDTMLGKVGDYYDREVDEAIDSLISAIEPLLMIFLGAVVGTIVAGMFLPMFSVMNAIG